jgi:hypothetical protein
VVDADPAALTRGDDDRFGLRREVTLGDQFVVAEFCAGGRRP